MAYDFPCDWRAGFVVDPTKHQRTGYLTAFNGLGLTDALKSDLRVDAPVNPDPRHGLAVGPGKTVSVIGILENVSWSGGIGDALSFSCYMSRENASRLQALKKMTLTTTVITAIGWWIANFDEGTKSWFEEFYPQAPIQPTGQLAVSRNDIRLLIGDEPVKVAVNIDADVFNVYFELVPAANQSAIFHVATPWGLVVGTKHN